MTPAILEAPKVRTVRNVAAKSGSLNDFLDTSIELAKRIALHAAFAITATQGTILRSFALNRTSTTTLDGRHAQSTPEALASTYKEWTKFNPSTPWKLIIRLFADIQLCIAIIHLATFGETPSPE